MGFGLENLVSAVMGAVAEVAEAGIKIATEVADVIAAQADIANILEDGQIDEDEQDRLLDDIHKLMVGAYLLGVGSYLAGVGSIKFGSESGSSSKDCSVSSWNEDIDSLPEYDPISARITENKRTRAKKKGVNGEYFAGRIDEFGNFIPDDIQGFTNIKVKEVDESALPYRALSVLEGIGDRAVNSLKNLKEAVIDHPVDTIWNSAKFLTDRKYVERAAINTGEEIKKSYDKQVVNGNQKSKDHFIGEAIFEIGSILLPASKAGNISKLRNISKVEKASEFVEETSKVGKFRTDYINEEFRFDPVNAVTGSLYIPAVDIVLPDIHEEFKVERKYKSINTSVGLFGRGWTSNVETYLNILNDKINVF